MTWLALALYLLVGGVVSGIRGSYMDDTWEPVCCVLFWPVFALVVSGYALGQAIRRATGKEGE